MPVMPGAALVLAAAALLAIQRMMELRLSSRNRRRLLSEGAREYGVSHYRLVIAMHVAWHAGWIVEALARGATLSPRWPLWLALALLAQALRYWSVAALGPRWTTQILVIPGRAPVENGPYRFHPHPNYIAVVIEIGAIPLLFGAWITAAVMSVANAALLLGVRVPAEQRAMRDAAGPLRDRSRQASSARD